MAHVHRAVKRKSRIIGWTHCVTGRADCGAAHGGVTHVDNCRCGATRKTESNGRRKASGGWSRTDFRPTHEIVIDTGIHLAGPSSPTRTETIAVQLVDGAAYTKEEWAAESRADWEIDPAGILTFQGTTHYPCRVVSYRKR
jgi:hypothetical protein